MAVTARGGYGRTTYDNVEGFDQSGRDRDIFTTGGRLGYIVSPGTRIFGNFDYNWRNYDGMLIPDSQGWRAYGGVQTEITHLIAGEVGIGYMEQTYDQFAGPSTTASGWTYHAGLTWNPTRLMTVNADADRTVEDSTIDTQGRIQDKFRLSLDYEVMRTLLASPWVGLIVNDYESRPIDDYNYQAGLNIDYKMNRYLSIGGRYHYTYNDRSLPGVSDYDRHLVGFYAKARF
jgi:hypothetical protein